MNGVKNMNKRTIVFTVAAMVALLTALIFVWEKPSAVMAAATEPPLLFCCVYPTSCVVAGDVTQCKNSGGVPADWVGCLASDTTCNDSNEECLLGACCLPDGTCTIMVRCWCENVAGGVYNGAGTTCADVDDCIINGACCLPSASCIVTNQYNCEVNNGGILAERGHHLRRF